MILKIKHPLLFFFLTLVPLFSVAQKINVTGTLSLHKSGNIVFERLKTGSSWKIWKGSDYKTEVDSSGRFNLSFPIAHSSLWKISIGHKRSKIHLDVNQNVYLELDGNLVVKKIIRQDLIDSPLRTSF
ncbi:hypothetical protein [Pedobacter sp. JCM 36344]|uniref:hypothetical protein n=1 Tax=Pedobacter sp. JCM 36344 TaxID=3374280 RepID=UPI00397E1FF2